MYYFDILKALHESGTDYLLVGGLAVNLYGAPRVTQDMDLVLAMRKDNILKFNRVLEELGGTGLDETQKELLRRLTELVSEEEDGV
jgi:hypothetical protein